MYQNGCEQTKQVHPPTGVPHTHDTPVPFPPQMVGVHVRIRAFHLTYFTLDRPLVVGLQK